MILPSGPYTVISTRSGFLSRLTASRWTRQEQNENTITPIMTGTVAFIAVRAPARLRTGVEPSGSQQNDQYDDYHCSKSGKVGLRRGLLRLEHITSFKAWQRRIDTI